MLNSKKLHFWRLTFIFGALIIITLFFLWSAPEVKKSEMMDVSMGNMMQSMHVSNVTLYDLFTEGEGNEQMAEMHSHHQGQAPVIYNLSFLTTSLIFLLLPFIIGGSIILAIVWIK